MCLCIYICVCACMHTCVCTCACTGACEPWCLCGSHRTTSGAGSPSSLLLRQSLLKIWEWRRRGFSSRREWRWKRTHFRDRSLEGKFFSAKWWLGFWVCKEKNVLKWKDARTSQTTQHYTSRTKVEFFLPLLKILKFSLFFLSVPYISCQTQRMATFLPFIMIYIPVTKSVLYNFS